MIQIIDDILPTQVFKTLQQKIVDNPTFPIYYTSNTVCDGNNDEYSFFHQVYDSSYKSFLFPYLEMCLLAISDKMRIEYKEIIRIRIGLITNIGKSNIHKAHIDYDFCDYYTGLLYLNNSDGETFVYNETYNHESNLNSFDYIERVLNNNLTVQQRIKPQENKFVLMDGNLYHSSSNPTIVPARYVINFNFRLKDKINIQ
jgi:hypothetical protein